jgi:hypothetical protein
MKKFLAFVLAAGLAVSALAALDVYTGIQHKAALTANTVETAAITGATVDVRSGKGIGTWMVGWSVGTNSAGVVTFVLQNSANGTSWSNATAASAVTITGTTPASVRATLVDMAVLSRYVRTIAVSTNQAAKVFSTIQYFE